MNYFKHDQALVHPKAQIGEGTRIWAFTNIQQGTVIGHHCNICDGCFIESGAVIGNHVTLKNQVAVWNGIILEDNVFVGAGTAFINDRHPRSHRKEPWIMEKIIVRRGASIGANATIMCGVEIGEGAVVGAGAVVLNNVAAHTTVVGNPALPARLAEGSPRRAGGPAHPLNSKS